MVIPPAGADDGMLTEVGDAEACAPVPEAGAEVERPGVNEGGSGAKAPSMQRSAQRAKKKGRMRVMLSSFAILKLVVYVCGDGEAQKMSRLLNTAVEFCVSFLHSWFVEVM